MGKIVNLDGKEAAPDPQLAPNDIYYALYDRLVKSYVQWAHDYLKEANYLVEIEKIKYKIGEAANAMLNLVNKDFTIQGDQKNDKS